MGMFGGPDVSCHQTYSARDWLSILRTSYPTQNLQRKHRTDFGDGMDQRVQSLMLMKHEMELKRAVNVTGLTVRTPFLRNRTRDRIAVSRRFATV